MIGVGLLPVILPEDGVALAVDRADGHPSLVGMVEVDWVLEEIVWEQPRINLHPENLNGWDTIQRRAAVGAQPVLHADILLADSAAVLKG